VTSTPATDGKAGEPSPGRPAEKAYQLEVSGDFDRATAEALMLEIQRLGRRHGLMLNGRVERAPGPRGGHSE